MSQKDELTIKLENQHQQALLRKWRKKANERNGVHISFRKELKLFRERRTA